MMTKTLLQTAFWYGAMGVVLFLAAGTLHWVGAWIYLIQMAVYSIICGFWLMKRDPGLLKERLSPPIQKGQPAIDKLIISLILVLFFTWLLIAGLDAVRFHWTFVPLAVQVFGELMLIGALAFVTRVMLENSFAAPVVKDQQYRGQHVVTTGPYRYVRHPMYLGAIFYFTGTSLLFGSLVSIAIVAVEMALFAWRTYVEEAALSETFPEYKDYQKKVPFRLIPFVW